MAQDFLPSVVRYTLSQKSPNISSEKFIVPRREVSNDDDFTLLKNWLANLELEIYKKNLEMEENNLKFERDEFKQKLPLLLFKIAKSLLGKSSGFGVCFDSIKNKVQIQSALNVFEETQTVCVFTLNRESDAYKDSKGWFIQAINEGKFLGNIIELSQLQSQEVKEVLQNRWSCLASNHQFPFEKIENAFNDLPTFGRLMNLVNLILLHNIKVASRSNPDLVWTGKEEELFFRDEKVEAQLKDIKEYSEFIERIRD